MASGETLRLTLEEARGIMMAAQGLLDPPHALPRLVDVRATVERLGVVQIDTISVVARAQYLTLWSRLGPYAPDTLDALLYPNRAVFEYWGHAASIIPMADYPYYRPKMLDHAAHMWSGNRAWMERNPDTLRDTLEEIRARGPLSSADFETPPGARRTGPWDWHGPKDSRRALEILWTTGDVMVYSRQRGQKRYDPRERVLAEAFGDAVPRDDNLPGPEERQRHFVRRTTEALGVVTPSWLWDYFRLKPVSGAGTRRAALAALTEAREAGMAVPATIEGIAEPAFVARARLPDLERLRSGYRPERTTLLSPFDSLIWDRARARALFGYEVCFEAYVPPPRRRYGYYCLAILHRGRLVGRLDPKTDRDTGRLLVRAIHLEPDVPLTNGLLDGLADALRGLARFVAVERVVVDGSNEEPVAAALADRLGIG